MQTTLPALLGAPSAQESTSGEHLTILSILEQPLDRPQLETEMCQKLAEHILAHIQSSYPIINLSCTLETLSASVDQWLQKPSPLLILPWTGFRNTTHSASFLLGSISGELVQHQIENISPQSATHSLPHGLLSGLENFATSDAPLYEYLALCPGWDKSFVRVSIRDQAILFLRSSTPVQNQNPSVISHLYQHQYALYRALFAPESEQDSQQRHDGLIFLQFASSFLSQVIENFLASLPQAKEREDRP